MAGRKAIYDPKTLEIGQKIELKGKAKKFKDQYLYQFRRKTGLSFQIKKEENKIYIERI